MAISLNKVFHKKFKFDVFLGDLGPMAFQTMSDLSVEAATIEHREGGALYSFKSPGLISYPNVTFTKGVAYDLTDVKLYGWMKQVIDPKGFSGSTFSAVGRGDGELLGTAYKDVSINQYDRDGLIIRQWVLTNAFPVRFKAGDWDNDADENVIVELELAFESFDRLDLFGSIIPAIL